MLNVYIVQHSMCIIFHVPSQSQDESSSYQFLFPPPSHIEEQQKDSLNNNPPNNKDETTYSLDNAPHLLSSKPPLT